MTSANFRPLSAQDLIRGAVILLGLSQLTDTVLLVDRLARNHGNVVLQRIKVGLLIQHLMTQHTIRNWLLHSLKLVVVRVPKLLSLAEFGSLHDYVRVVSPFFVLVACVFPFINIGNDRLISFIVVLDWFVQLRCLTRQLVQLRSQGSFSRNFSRFKC